MRNLMKLIKTDGSFYVLFLSLALFISCAGAAGVGATCSPYGITGSCGGEIKACCTSSKCWYTYNGDKYNCNALDCTQAAVTVVNASNSCSAANLGDNTSARMIDSLIETSKEISKEAGDEEF